MRTTRTLESDMLDTLWRALREQGWMRFHPWLSIHSAGGWPDIVAGRRLQLLVWELKNETAQPTPEQVAWLDWWANFAAVINGGTSFGEFASQTPPFVHVALVRPKDLEAAYRTILRGIGPDGPDPDEWPIGRPDQAAIDKMAERAALRRRR